MTFLEIVTASVLCTQQFARGHIEQEFKGSPHSLKSYNLVIYNNTEKTRDGKSQMNM